MAKVKAIQSTVKPVSRLDFNQWTIYIKAEVNKIMNDDNRKSDFSNRLI